MLKLELVDEQRDKFEIKILQMVVYSKLCQYLLIIVRYQNVVSVVDYRARGLMIS